MTGAGQAGIDIKIRPVQYPLFRAAPRPGEYDQERWQNRPRMLDSGQPPFVDMG